MSNAVSNTLVIGPDAAPIVTFDNASIAEIGGTFSTDVVGDELPWDEAEALVQYGRPDAPNYETPGVDLRAIPYGTPCKWVHGGTRVVRMYLSRFDRVGKYLYRPTLISGVGLLANVQHAGGVYTGQTFPAVAAEIIGNLFDYEVGAELEEQAVYNWLPYDNARTNLHRLLFALGAAIRKTEDGVLRFGFLSASDPVSVPDSRVAFGGSVEYIAPATGAEITEHAYFLNGTEPLVALWDNTDTGSAAADHTQILFGQDGPVDPSSLTATTGLTINERHPNYAVVTGTGVLSGKLYTHTTRIVSEMGTGTGAPNVARVEDNPLISAACSKNVAKRVLAYCASAKTVRARIALQNERTGVNLSLNDPYGEPMTAFLRRMDVNASTNLLGECELVEGYTPTGQGNNIQKSDLVTGSGTYTVPAGVTELIIVLVGGGQGGQGGRSGTAGTANSGSKRFTAAGTLTVAAGAGGTGGAAGAAGSAGKILVITVAVTPGQTITYSCGAKGTGGAVGGGAGTAGGVTTVTVGGVTYSSADGEVLPAGYYDVAQQMTVGAPGTDGAAGANGGRGGSASQQSAGNGNSGGDTSRHTGGNGGSGYYNDTELIRFRTTLAGAGGGGGGASPNGNGGSGSRGTTYSDTTNGGHGGAGASATAPAPRDTYGSGGDGGNGGGGGGGTGAYYFYHSYSAEGQTPFTASYSPTAGPAGAGSKGGDGGAGCVIFEYSEEAAA